MINATDVRLPYEPPGVLLPDGSPGVCNAYLPHKINGEVAASAYIDRVGPHACAAAKMYSAGGTCTISASMMYFTVNFQVNENLRLCHVACHTGSDTLDRFIWVLSFLARNDFVVVPVDQLQYDDGVVVDRHTWGKVGRLPPSTQGLQVSCGCLNDTLWWNAPLQHNKLPPTCCLSKLQPYAIT